MRLWSGLMGLGAVITAGAVQAEPPPGPGALALMLREGGVVIYFRHPATDASRQDAPSPDFSDCTTQRNLSDAGRRDAEAIGAAMRIIGVRLGRVATSEYCRAKETAARMGLADAETDALLNDGGRMLAAGPTSAPAEALRDRLRTDPGAGRVAVVVAHRPNIVDAAGPAFADLGEGEAAVFRPAEALPGFTPVARIRVSEWAAIAAAQP